MAAFSFRGGVGGGGEGGGNGDAAAAVASMMSHQAARSDAAAARQTELLGALMQSTLAQIAQSAQATAAAAAGQETLASLMSRSIAQQEATNNLLAQIDARARESAPAVAAPSPPMMAPAPRPFIAAEFSGIAAFPPRPRVRRCTRTPRRPSLLLRQRTATTTAGSPLEPASAAAR